MEISGHRARRAASLAGTLSILWACPRAETGAGASAVQDTSVAGQAAAAVRSRYRRGDAIAAGAWTWTAPNGRVYVLVDVQSTVQGLVQARADLWTLDDTIPVAVGRSDVMPSAAELGGYAFEDLTGDGVPDLFGFVADSSGETYPVLLIGARGALTEQIALAAPDWRFVLDEEHQPRVVKVDGKVCALEMWSEAPADKGAEGLRWLPIQPDGTLGAPVAAQPACAAPTGATGLQPRPGTP